MVETNLHSHGTHLHVVFVCRFGGYRFVNVIGFDVENHWRINMYREDNRIGNGGFWDQWRSLVNTQTVHVILMVLSIVRATVPD